MSIPPLVCSTPPPPDQCEDERDIDFDIQYNLSQDDEEDVNCYNFGYSDYIYSTSSSTNIQSKCSPDISKKAENKLPIELSNKKMDSISILPESTSSNVNKVGFEDIVIEDLNLKVENETDVVSSMQNLNKCDTESSKIEGSSKELDTSIHSNTNINKNDDFEACITAEDFKDANLVNNDEKLFDETIQPYMEATFLETQLHEPFDVDTHESDVISINDPDKTYLNDDTCISLDANVLEIKLIPQETDKLECKLDQHLKGLESTFDQMDTDDLDSTLNQKDVITSEITLSQNNPNTLENKLDGLESKLDDDFGDFDDFQFTSTEIPPATIEYCDNPWDSEVSKGCEFGEFTANFDGNEINLQSQINNAENDIENEKEMSPVEPNDDFGEFDDFKSSSNDCREEIVVNNEPSQNVQVFSLYSPDSEGQIIESINSVVTSIFTSEITEIDNSSDTKVESSLNETWGHLVDTDVRQSYIVNWNNSVGQKSLLKALCIDSRNILFGPKWSNGMPKYAANLTVAPLQPQKPFTQTITVNSEEHNSDRTTNKEPTSWTDPFTSDGQESCNTEGGTPAEIARPTDLDVFTNVPEKINKIYSAALSVQPIRQINLPDTHIFTPTDSETPRSKTIHYDNGASVLVPQATNQTDDSLSQPRSQVAVNNSENDEDDWEFQDFKGPIKNKNTTSEDQIIDKFSVSASNSTLQKAATHETQILQPIKIEPVMPTLNWPAPGEVKETFDDFSDFISKSSWNENMNTVHESDNQLISKTDCVTMSKAQSLDDDFDTFQSAPTLASTVATKEISGVNTNHHNLNDFPQNSTEDNELSHNIHSKINAIDVVKSKDNIGQSRVPLTAINTSPTVKHNNVTLSPASNSGNPNMNTLLQPSVAATSGSQRNQKKSGQILQPLSLESYSQINWPNPGIDLQDLSRFNPVETLQSLKNDVSTGGSSKLASPAHKDVNVTRNEISDEDIWGDFVSSNPKQQQSNAKKLPTFADDDEWTDFVSSPSVKPQNGLNTISLNVHTNLSMQKNSAQNKFPTKSNQMSLDIPTLNYVTPKSSSRGVYNEKHFQNL